MVLQRTFKLFTAVALKRIDWRQVQWFHCCCCLASATAEKAEAGLVDAAIVTQWWLEKRRHVVAF